MWTFQRVLAFECRLPSETFALLLFNLIRFDLIWRALRKPSLNPFVCAVSCMINYGNWLRKGDGSRSESRLHWLFTAQPCDRIPLLQLRAKEPSSFSHRILGAASFVNLFVLSPGLILAHSCFCDSPLWEEEAFLPLSTTPLSSWQNDELNIKVAWLILKIECRSG